MFIATPQNTTAYAGHEAQFSCALSLNQHSHILWYVLVSGSYIFFALLPPKYGASTRTHQQGVNELMSVLTIDALAEINGTLIECRGDSPTNPPIYSSAALSVQGLLAVPSDLIRTIKNYTISIEWSAPFTLPGSSMEFRIDVSIAGHPISLSVRTPHTNQTFTYSSLNISRCDSDHMIEFSVCGINLAGEGQPSSITVSIANDRNLCEIPEGPLAEVSTARGSTVPSFPGYAANIIIGVTGALIVVVTLSVLTVTFVAFYFLRKRKFNTSSGNKLADSKMDTEIVHTSRHTSGPVCASLNLYQQCKRSSKPRRGKENLVVIDSIAPV